MIPSILIQYKKRLVFYLSVLETDKHTENIALLRGKSGTDKFRLAPNYDSEFSLLLENAVDLSDYIVDFIDDEADMQDPKIGVKVPKENFGWGSVWKDTLEKLIEDDEIYDYAQEIVGKIDMDEVFEKVEKKIHAKLPNDVKRIAKAAYNSRNTKMKEIVLGEYDYDKYDGNSQENTFSEKFLHSILGESINTNISLSELEGVERTLTQKINEIRDSNNKEDDQEKE